MTIFIIKYGNYLTKNMTDWSVTWSSRSLYNHIFLRGLSLSIWILQESVVVKWSGLVAVLPLQSHIFEGSIAKCMDFTGKCGRKVVRTVAVLPDYWINYSWSDQSWPLNHEPSCITITRPRKIHDSQFFLQTPFISSPIITGPACALLVPFLLLGLCYLHFNPSLSLCSVRYPFHKVRFRG